MILFLGVLVTCLGLSFASPVVTPANVLPTSSECGIVSSKSTNKDQVVGLRDAPWTCLIEYFDYVNNKTGRYCTCVLINQQHGLAVSSCVLNKHFPPGLRPYRIILGEWDSDCLDGDCALTVQKILVSKVVTHPQFDPTSDNPHNDIAIIRFETPVIYNDYVKPICLPLEISLRTKEYVGEALEVSGWGDNQSHRKLTVPINVVERSTCASVYAPLKFGIIDTQICAGGEGGEIPCSGGGGAPLVATDSSSLHNSKYLVGLATYRPTPCGRNGHPNVFTKVSEYIDWVQDTMEP